MLHIVGGLQLAQMVHHLLNSDMEKNTVVEVEVEQQIEHQIGQPFAAVEVDNHFIL